MSLIGEILPLSHIVLDLEVGSKKRLFEEAGLLLEHEAELPHGDVFDCLFAREKLGSTGLGQGVAIPHGRHACVKKATGAFIRTKEPVALSGTNEVKIRDTGLPSGASKATGPFFRINAAVAFFAQA